jgi:hypothetical protein
MNQSSPSKMARTLRVIVLIVGLSFALASPAQTRPPVVHVFVVLADNQHQGIVPVPPRLGNGQDAASNLYWGAAFGVKTFFKYSTEWKLLSCGQGPKAIVLERCIFEHRNPAAFLVADAYDGAYIREGVVDLLNAAAGTSKEMVTFGAGDQKRSLAAGSEADLVVYVGHDAFMNFQVPTVAGKKEHRSQKFIILACASRAYFRPYMKETGSEPLLWTTGLMAPEAYTLKAALEGWLAGEGPDAIRMRAAEVYNKYQECGLRAAQRLFVSGW